MNPDRVSNRQSSNRAGRSQQMNQALRQCRIAIVDSRPRLHGKIASLLHNEKAARGFLSIDSLLARPDDAPTVVVVGPSLMNTTDLEMVIWFMDQRPNAAVVLAVTEPSQELMEWAAQVGISDVIDLRTEAGQLADAVDAAAAFLLGITTPDFAAPYAVNSPAAYMPLSAPPDMSPMIDTGGYEVDELAAAFDAQVGDDQFDADAFGFGFAPETSSYEEVQRAEIITVFSTKGGTGKSVVASNLAVKLAQKSNRPVVLLDADFQFGDLAVMMKLQPEHSLADVVASIDRLDTAMMENLLVQHEASGVFLLASPTMPVVGEFIDAEGMTRILEVLSQMAAYIVVDTQSHIDEATLAILHNSTEIVLVGNMDIPSMKDMKIGLSLLRSLDVSLERSRLVMNRANAKAALDIKAVERSLHHRVDAMVSSDVLIPQSVNRRSPAVLEQPGSGISKSMDLLIDLLEQTD